MNPWIMRAFDLAVALIAGAGLVLILAAALARRPSFVDRVAQGRVQERPTSILAAWARRVSTSALDSLGSTTESVARRLSLAGMNPDVSLFRLRQAVAGVVGLVAACALVAARHASSLRASLIPLCACALVGTLLGVAGMDRFLTMRANARQRAIDAAVPDCSELLALAVAAGESIPAAIERVAGCAGGPLGAELSLTAGHIRNGTPSVRALANLVERTESPALTRLSRTLTTAIERGSPWPRSCTIRPGTSANVPSPPSWKRVGAARSPCSCPSSSSSCPSPSCSPSIRGSSPWISPREGRK